ncbi:DUF1800 domain-containing protein [Formosa maritima]|uniref:DUF1800 domain-containing protein n=1 Tax=Formosa maritima TaxID=2592046 RepID=A0A5D0GMD2_9FLAO|nr:DUF1800 domain-containing protein [Formosa maritima]TYA60174.1 DUF1800 domain-containing protein [Formosa maritima]
MTIKHIQHLYWRAGFGINPNQLQLLSIKNREQNIDELFRQSNSYNPLFINTSEFDTLTFEEFTKTNKIHRAYIEKSKLKVKELNHAWIDKISNSKEILREKMTLFWANHFVCQDRFILYIQKYNNTLRYHALGNFKDFIKDISKEPSMINYLDLKQNKIGRPNENFARELLELFTLGVGNYSEDDIKEIAKAFTGYNYDFEGDFVFKENQHNNDFKYVFGKSGHYDGDDIIDIILEQKQCARFICTKLYQYFVNTTLNENYIEDMTNIFYPNYNIESVLRYMFTQDWFYYSKNIGNKIKSPIELIAGLSHTIPVTFKETDQIINIQRMLGQMLLYPPNVAGWKGGKSWIDSNTLMIRLKLPSALLSNAKISTKEEGDFYDTYSKYYENRKGDTKIKVSANWDVFKKNFQHVKVEELQGYLLQCSINLGTQDYLNRLSKKSKEAYCVQLMSLPEYQMC